jgi:hypothetical protein
MPVDSHDPNSCRLCGGAVTQAFRMLVLAKYEISCHSCRECGSLQTEQPYWLPEAYANPSVDPGAARRTLDSYALVELVARIFQCHTMLDFGGNTGLLCRLLRDHEYAAYCFDRYLTATYARQFIGSPADRYDLVSAFEVMEHFEHPAEDLEQIFGARPRIVVASTELFCGQMADWWYLAPREGQHIFFYSEKAVRLIAARYCYNVLFGKSFLLFNREPFSAVQRTLIPWLLRPRALRLVGAVLLMQRGEGADKDFVAMTATSAGERSA